MKIHEYQAKEELEKLITSYNMYQAEPVQVAGEDGSTYFPSGILFNL